MFYHLGMGPLHTSFLDHRRLLMPILDDGKPIEGLVEGGGGPTSTSTLPV